MSAARTRKKAATKKATPAAAPQTLVAVLPDTMPLADAVAARLDAAAPALALTRVDTLEEALERTGGPVLLPVPHPLLVLARSLEAGASAAEALAGWTGAAQDLLAALRRDRKRAVLVDAGALAAGHPGAFDILQTRFGLDLPAARKPGLPEPDPGPEPDPAALARAVVALWADAEAGELAETLAAMQHGPQTPPRLAPGGLDALFARPAPDPVPAAAEPVAEPDPPAGADHEEHHLLRDSLAELLEEADRLEAERGALQARLDRQEDALADRHLLAALNDSLEKRLQDRDAERRAREGLLGSAMLRDARDRLALEETVARLQAERDAARADLQALQDHAEALKGELDRVYGSNSWKITAPMRAARRPLSKSDS